MKIAIGAIALVVSFLGSVPTHAAVQYTITDLGTLGGARSEAWGINNKGQVVGASYTDDGVQHAFRTAANLPINPATDDLGTLGGLGSNAHAINDEGVVVGQADTPAQHAYGNAFRAAADANIDPATDDLGTLGGLGSIACEINNNGQVVGWSYTTSPDTSHAFRTTPGQPINRSTDDLGTLGGRESYAYSINNNGQVVGQSQIRSGATHAFRTSANRPINSATDDIGTLGGTSSAFGINDLGQVVGKSYLGDNTTCHAFRTAANLPINPATDDLGTLGGTYSVASDVNDSGQIVGGSWLSGSVVMHAFLFSGNGPMQDLNTLISSASGWELSTASGINDSGQIAGYGTINGNRHAFLLTPVPEPSALALLGMGGIGLIAWGWRRRKQAVRLMALLAVALTSGGGIAMADVFNMGSGLTSLELVSVRDINNQTDTQVMQWGDGTTGYGSVGHAYNIGKYEVTAAQYTEFLNAVAADDTHELYSPYMDASFNIYGCNIKRSGVSGSYTYSVLAEWANRPVNWVTWGDSARFVNWLNNGRPAGAQGPQTTEDGAYLLNGAMSDTELMAVQSHKPGAKYWLPTENEWYKAAYYKGGGTNAGYWLYPTQSDSAPGRDMTETAKPGNNLNSYGYPFPIEPGHYATVGGEFQLSDSAYGTFDQGGNVMEWNEAVVWDSSRGLRGGSFNDYDWDHFVSTYRYSLFPSRDAATIGFRVATVPEPSTIALLLTASLGGLLWWRRRK